MDKEILNLLQEAHKTLDTFNEADNDIEGISIDLLQVREVKDRIETLLEKERTDANVAAFIELSDIKIIANRIVVKLDEDELFKSQVRMSPEPIRTMIYQSGVVSNPYMIDGSDYYHKIVDEIERIY